MNQAQRLTAAKALNGNPLLDEAFSKAIGDCILSWQSSQNAEDREALWHRVKAIQLVRNEVNATVKSALRDEQQKHIDE